LYQSLDTQQVTESVEILEFPLASLQIVVYTSGKCGDAGMAGINRSTYFEPREDETIQRIAQARKWSISQTIGELVRESPSFRAEYGHGDDQLPSKSGASAREDQRQPAAT
jgi:hypothetical protein